MRKIVKRLVATAILASSLAGGLAVGQGIPVCANARHCWGERVACVESGEYEAYCQAQYEFCVRDHCA